MFLSISEAKFYKNDGFTFTESNKIPMALSIPKLD